MPTCYTKQKSGEFNLINPNERHVLKSRFVYFSKQDRSKMPSLDDLVIDTRSYNLISERDLPMTLLQDLFNPE